MTRLLLAHLIAVLALAVCCSPPVCAAAEGAPGRAAPAAAQADRDRPATERAADFFSAGEYSAAIHLLESHLKEHPADADTKELLLKYYRAVFRHNQLERVLDTTTGAMQDNLLMRLGLETLNDLDADELLNLPDIYTLKTPDDLWNMDRLKRMAKVSDYMNLASFYEKIGDVDALAEGLNGVLRLDPDNAAANLKLGLLHAEKGDVERAQSYFAVYLGNEARGVSVLRLYAAAYLHAKSFALASLGIALLGLVMLVSLTLKADVLRRRWLLLAPLVLALVLLGLSGSNWWSTRSLAAFLILAALAGAPLLWLAGRALYAAFGPVIRGFERLVGGMWGAGASVFSGRLSGRLAELPKRYLVLMLALIVPLSLSLLSIVEQRDLQLAAIISAGLLFFSLIGALAVSFLKQNESLARTLRYLSLFNTIPFLLIFLYLAGGLVERLIHLTLADLNSYETRLFLSSLILYLFGLGFAMYLAAIQARAILGPVRRLTHAASRVSAGDLDTRIEVESNNELGTLSGAFNEMVEGLRQREFIRQTFGRFVDPRVVARVLADGQIDMGGKAARCVVLFTDIRGFTSLSERVDPHELVETLNDYFTRMVQIVEQGGGLLNKFIGDAMMVVWGGLTGDEPDAARACRTALAMQAELKRMNAERLARGEWTLAMGIGINMGEVIAGHIGSSDRLEWTVMGDNVNLAQRAEANAKDGQILVSPAAFETLGDRFEAERLDPITVKGKREPIAFYNILSERRVGSETNGE